MPRPNSGCPPDGQPTTVTFTTTDECGNAAIDTADLSVVDTLPPELACAVAVDRLWPPNHGFVDVGLSVVTDDLCDVDPPTLTVAVTSDEHPSEELGAGGPNHCPDAIVGDGRSVRLRAERSGNGDGRVYRIAVTATDSCGNATACEVEVAVPKKKKDEVVDSGQAYDATACD